MGRGTMESARGIWTTLFLPRRSRILLTLSTPLSVRATSSRVYGCCTSHPVRVVVGTVVVLLPLLSKRVDPGDRLLDVHTWWTGYRLLAPLWNEFPGVSTSWSPALVLGFRRTKVWGGTWGEGLFRPRDTRISGKDPRRLYTFPDLSLRPTTGLGLLVRCGPPVHSGRREDLGGRKKSSGPGGISRLE